MAKPKPSAKAPASASAPVADLGALLSSAVLALQTNTPFWATTAEMAPLINHANGQLVEHNPSMVQGDKVAFRATALGLQAHNAGAFTEGKAPAMQSTASAAPAWGTPSPRPTQAAQPARTFVFKKGIPVPPARRGGRGSDGYGFEQMEVGDAFDIPMSTDNPNPAKRVASTVSSASKRLTPKKFIVRSVLEGDPPAKLARVWRTA